jgi:hypothetical protein
VGVSVVWVSVVGVSVLFMALAWLRGPRAHIGKNPGASLILAGRIRVRSGMSRIARFGWLSHDGVRGASDTLAPPPGQIQAPGG